jgi:hypothetical protein
VQVLRGAVHVAHQPQLLRLRTQRAERILLLRRLLLGGVCCRRRQLLPRGLRQRNQAVEAVAHFGRAQPLLFHDLAGLVQRALYVAAAAGARGCSGHNEGELWLRRSVLNTRAPHVAVLICCCARV